MLVSHKAYKTGKKALRLAALFGTMLSAGTAFGATLKDQTVVSDPVVRLSDLFTDAGERAETVVMQAPAPGKSRQLSAGELDRIAKQFDLAWERPALLKHIIVAREGVTLDMNDLASLVHGEALMQGASDNSEVQIFGNRSGLYLPQDASINDVTFENFTLSPQGDRFTAVVLLPTGTGQPDRLSLAGSLIEMRLVPMLTRVITPGEVIQPSDITWEKVAVRRIGRQTVSDIDTLVGQTVRRALPAGKMIFENDIKTPVVIARGSLLTMTLKAGNMVLTAGGRALEDGGEGEIIRVMNVKSKQSVDARVIRPGLVEVTSSPNQILASM